ncbi:uncharacterized protein LOC131692960 [Topomyia yanbarensis]|uniref:uncharacterized protein LOC131692960 n=1 Tax=Topomyia yanbarensis TaxID=2498891 RepID=UPI00273BFEB7|nr:uncharacterized protein LOC131692960 [Topomyia yanbarensis]XP_058836380.1 uncharacterized protein LOC131692960 [Topomyia yanbarensis]XP_058836381.1 uncharacterized protein LOC131692960 [Topomyia yanbarensis]
MQTQGTPGTPAGNGECNCVACNEPDSAGNMVQCDHCNSWWHMTCAGVTDSIADRPWTCRRCLPEIVSIQSNSTVRKLRLDLKLKQLEEQRAVEQKFVDEKYKLLNSHLEEPDESASQRGKVCRVEKVEQVKQWLKCSADQTESADTAASSILPSEPRKREERLCDLTRTQHVDDQNQVAKLRLPEQLELLAEQLRQQQTFAGERRRSLEMHPEQHMQQPAPSLWKISPEFVNSCLQMKKQTSMSGNDQGNSKKLISGKTYHLGQENDRKCDGTEFINPLFKQFGPSSTSGQNATQNLLQYTPTPSQIAARQVMPQ